MAQTGSPPSLTELIGRVIAKDEEAQRALFERYAPRVYGYVRHQLETNRCVQPSEDCKDVANSILCKALDPEKLKKLDNPEAFPGWLYTTTKRDVIAHLRQCTTNPNIELEDCDYNEPAARSSTTEESIEASERIQQILIRARSIDERLPKILDLTIQGYTAQEIGEQLGISPNNVRTIRGRGLFKLKLMLKERYE